MSAALVIDVVIALLFSVMAFRAFSSGGATDYLLGAAQSLGVLLSWSHYHDIARYLLLLTAFAYLVSQILTGARVISRLLPMAGAVMIVLSLLR